MWLPPWSCPSIQPHKLLVQSLYTLFHTLPQVLPFPAGSAVHVEVSVNGIPALTACPDQTIDATASDGLGAPLPLEPSSAAITGGECMYMYTSYRTPQLWYPPSPLPSLNAPVNLTLTGALLGGWTSSSPYSATVGGVTAPVLLVSGTAAMQRVTLGLPTLPAGTWPVSLLVSGFGAARGPLGLSSSIVTVRCGFEHCILRCRHLRCLNHQHCLFPSHSHGCLLMLSYGLTVTSSGLPAASASFWGGVVLSVVGTGFVPTSAASGMYLSE